MSIIDPVKKWIVGIGLKKGVVSAAKLIVSYAIAHGLKASFIIGGIGIDITDEAAMVVAINSGLAVLKNWLKVKWPEKFWFL